MILIRYRPYGTAEWTQAMFDGEQEQQGARWLSDLLGCFEGLHVQLAQEGSEWFDLAEFSWEDE